MTINKHLLLAKDALMHAHRSQQKKEAVDPGDFIYSPDQALQLAQAEALIAIAEAIHPQFVQVDGRRFDANAITQIEDFGEGITVYLVSGPAVQLRGPAKTAFLLWHERHANVTRLEVVQ